MPHNTSRRSLLAAFSAVSVAAALPSPVLAHPAAHEAMSEEVAELTRLFDAARSRTLAALTACEAAESRYKRPSVPEALFHRPGEPLHGYVRARTGPGGRFWYGDREHIETLRDWPMDLPGWEAQHARRTEILAAYDAWMAATEAAQKSAGITDAYAEYTAAWEEEERPVRARIVALRSTEPAALLLKVRAYLASVAAADWQDDLKESIRSAAEREGGPWQDTMAASILRDLVTTYAPADA